MFLDNLNWRYATKKMDPTKAVDEDTVAKIVEAVRMAPTSSGLQPFKLIVVRDPEVREKLKAAANGQTQITDGSHVLVFAAWDDYTEARLDEALAMNEAARGSNEGMVAYYDMLKGAYLGREALINHNHAARQAYIGLGFALAAAAELKVDSTPMEGFNADQFDEILGLKEMGLHTVTILPLGYREEGNDWLLGMAKVRRSHEDFVIEV